MAEAGSLNAAARALGISQQAVSARIASIEKQTGVQLVSRTPQGSMLTPAGVSVAEWADRLLNSAAELDAGLAALRHDQRTLLRVSASLTIAAIILWLMNEKTRAKELFTQLLTDHDPKHETWASSGWVNQLWDFEWPKPFREALLEMGRE